MKTRNDRTRRLQIRLVIPTAVFAVAAAMSMPALASGSGGHGGGGGGGGGTSTPKIQFKSSSFSVTEGTTYALITVQRSPKGADQVYFYTNGSPDGAVGASDCSDPATDYVAVPISGPQLVNIGANGLGTARVQICDNSYFENTEHVNLALMAAGSTPVGTQGTASLAIFDNDPAPVLSVDNQSGVEGSTQTFTVTASSADPLLPMTVHWATADGTATVADGDYAAQSGDVAIAPGNTTTTFSVTSIDDSVYEPGPAQYFWVNLSAPINATLNPLASSGKFSLTDNDSPPTLSVNDQSVTEGGTLTFTVTRTGLTDAPATFDWSTAANGSAYAGAFGTDCSTPGFDYVSAFATAVSIPAGGASNTATFQVVTCSDTTPESDETFTVNLANPGNATISDGTGIGTILDSNNGGFETGDLTGWLTYVDGTAPTPSATTDSANSGSYSAVIGTPCIGLCFGEPSGNSAVYRNVTIPATGTTTLSFWVNEAGDGNGIDDQFAQVKDANTFAVLDTIFNDGSNNTSGTWLHKTYNLTPFAGQTVQLIWVASQDGAGAPTGMYLDDVQITTGA